MKMYKKRYSPPGTHPGLFSTDQLAGGESATISLVSLSADEMLEQHNVHLKDLHSLPGDGRLNWIQVRGYHANPVLVSQIGEIFNLDVMALEDVVHTGQRPKVDEYDDQLVVILSVPSYENTTLEFEQISLFLKKNLLISFCEAEQSLFDPLVKRLNAKKSIFYSRGIDYLFYSIVDLVVDIGFPVLDSYGNLIESLEEKILISSRKPKSLTHEIYILRKELIGLRRMLWPHRDVINSLIRDEPELIQESTRLSLRDCNDHAIQIREFVDHYREMLEGMHEIYMSNESFKLNDILRILTVISTIFIPLTFVAAIYGMNFNPAAGEWNMPELNWAFGYPLVLIVMAVIVAGMVTYFRSKKWL